MPAEAPDGTRFVHIEPRLLTDQERHALLEREDHGIHAVAMRQFETVGEFRDGQNNFYMTFTAMPGKAAWEIYRGKLAFQRFQALNPDLCQSLDERLQGRDRASLGEEDWVLLHQAYSEISQLVDVNDPDIMRDGEVRTADLFLAMPSALRVVVLNCKSVLSLIWSKYLSSRVSCVTDPHTSKASGIYPPTRRFLHAQCNG